MLAYRDGRYKRLDFKMKLGRVGKVRFSGQGKTFKCEWLDEYGQWLDFTDEKSFFI